MRQIVAVAAMIGVLVLGVACNSSSTDDPTPVATFKITPASGLRAASATPTPATASAQTTSTSTGTASAGGGDVTIAAKNSTLKFDKDAITVTAGKVTIVFENADAGIAHNISVFEGTSASGTKLGATDIEAGPIKQPLTVDLKPGSYFFHCDVHPTTMKGTITAQ